MFVLKKHFKFVGSNLFCSQNHFDNKVYKTLVFGCCFFRLPLFIYLMCVLLS